MIRFVYKIIPVPVIYKDWLVKDGMAGRSYNFFVAIRKDQKGNEALLQHELVHIKQFYRTLGLHSIMYHSSRDYRLKCEIEAYKATIKAKGYTSKSQSLWIVESLYNDYDLNVSKDRIIELLYEV